MFLDPEKFPRWASPLVGGAVGFVLGLHVRPGLLEVGISTGCGVAAACLLMFVETVGAARLLRWVLALGVVIICIILGTVVFLG
jgi:hypothetical protein